MQNSPMNSLPPLTSFVETVTPRVGGLWGTAPCPPSTPRWAPTFWKALRFRNLWVLYVRSGTVHTSSVGNFHHKWWSRRGALGGRRWCLNGSPLLRLCDNLGQCSLSILERKELNVFSFLGDGRSNVSILLWSCLDCHDPTFPFVLSLFPVCVCLCVFVWWPETYVGSGSVPGFLPPGYHPSQPM